MLLKNIIESANTGLDAIERAPIVFEKTGLKCLRIQDISQSKKINQWGNTTVSEENRKSFLLRKEDIIIARTGSTIGVNLFISNDLPSVYNNGLIRLRINKHKALPFYIFCYLQTKHYINFIKSISGSSATQPNMRINDLLELNVPLKTIEEQQHIVDTIGSVDDLIEKNEEIIAKTHTYLDVKFNAFVNDSDKVKIAELDFFKICKSGIMKFNDNKIYLDTASVDQTNIIDESYSITYDNRPSRANMQPIANSIWFAKLKDSPKYILVKNQSKKILTNFIFSTGFLGLQSEEYLINYLYCFILSNDFNNQKNLLSNGATMQGINNDVLLEIKAPNIEREQAIDFGKTIESTINLILDLKDKNYQLKQIKSQLLQKYFG